MAKDLNTTPANKFVGITYSKKNYTIDDVPPLMHVINNIDSNRFGYYQTTKAEIWDIALTHNNDLKEYIADLLSNHNKIRNILKWPREDTQFGFNDMSSVLYHHGFLDSYVDSYPQESVKILYSAISKDYIEDVKKLIPLYQKSRELSPDNNHTMLHDARTPEMANLLMENGFSMNNYKPYYHDPEKKELLLALSREMNIETIDAILSFKPSHQEMMRKNPHFVFKEFFELEKHGKNSNFKSFDKMKLLIEHNFPLEEFDMLHVGFLLSKKDISYSQWFIDHGANPAHCENFVRALKHDNDFLQLLQNYSEIININAPDFIYELVNGIHYQNNIIQDYCKKISHEALLEPTEKGGYVWWGLNTNSPTFIKFIYQNKDELTAKIKNSFSSDTDSWIANLFLRNNFEVGFLEQYKQLFFSKEEKYPFKMQTDNQENILHKLFIEDTTSSRLNFFLKETDIDVKSLLQEKNKEGQTPLDKVFFEEDWKKEREVWKRQNERLAQMSKKIINHLKADFPFEAMINDKQKAIDVIKELFPEEKEFDDYYKESLKNKLVLQLPEKNIQQVKKIKI